MTGHKIDSWFPITLVSDECERERGLGSPVGVLPGFRSPLALARAVVLLSLSTEDAEREALLPALQPVIGEPWRTSIGALGEEPEEVRVFGDGSVALEAARAGRRVRLVAPDPAIARFFEEVFGRLLEEGEEALEELAGFLRQVGRVLRRRLSDLYGGGERAYLWIKRVRCPQCGLLIPLMEHRWIVKGSCALRVEVPEGGDEVEFEVVEPEEAGPGTLRAGRVTCPRCRESWGLERVRRSFLLRAARGGPAGAYLAAVVEDGSVRSATDPDLDRVERARELARELGRSRLLPCEDPPGWLRRWGVWDVSWMFNSRQLAALLEAVTVTLNVGESLEWCRVWAAAVLTELSLRNSVLSRWDPAVGEPGRAEGWAWEYGELPVPRAWEEVSSEILRACRELIEVAEGVEVEVEVADGGWGVARDLPDALFRAWSGALLNAPVWGTEGRGGSSILGGLSWGGRSFLVLRGDRVAERWMEVVGEIVGRGLRAASAWPVFGENALVVPLVERESPEEVDWEDVVSEVRDAVRRLLDAARDLEGRGWESVGVVPYAAALPPCTGLDVVKRGGDSLSIRQPEVLSEVLAEGWRELVTAVLELLNVGVSDPRARFYAVYRLLWGYRESCDPPSRRRLEPLLRALKLDPDELPYLSADGRLESYRERRELRPREDPVNAFHAALLAVREGAPESALEGVPENVRKEVLELARAVIRAARRCGENHPEVELARRLLGVSVGVAGR